MSVTPEQTFCVIVGIETYEMGADWQLPGPASDAVRLQKWLLERGVSEKNIRLHLSYADPPSGLGPGGAGPATSTVLNDLIEKELPTRREPLLLFFWGGHGVSEIDDDRKLFYADASQRAKRNLSLHALLELLRSTSARGFEQQVFVVDACANFFKAGTPLENLPLTKFGGTELPRKGVRQTWLTASSPGEPASNQDREKTGLYSSAFYQQLEQEKDWPPDFDAVHDRVVTEFNALRIDQKSLQTPWRGTWGVTGRATRGTVGAGSTRGPWQGPAWRDRCNRDLQESRLRARLLPHLQQSTAPLVVIAHGHEDEGHESLVRRLAEGLVKSAAEERWSSTSGTVKALDPLGWPASDLSIEDQRATLQNIVVKGLDPAYGGLGADPAPLLARPNYAGYRVVVVPHLLRLDEWSRPFEELLRWYVDSYWGPYRSDEQSPHVLLMIMMKLAKPLLEEPRMRLRLFPSARERFIDRIQKFRDGSALTARAHLGDLTPISYDEVEAWLRERQHASEQNLKQTARRLFDTAMPPVGDRRRYLSLQEALDRMESQTVTGQISP